MTQETFQEQILKRQESSRKAAEQKRLAQKLDSDNVHFQLNEIRKNSRYFKITHLRLYFLNGQEVIMLPPNVARTLQAANHDILMFTNGGLTTIESVDNGGKKHVGVARCHINDNFSRAEGRKFALKNYLYNLKTT